MTLPYRKKLIEVALQPIAINETSARSPLPPVVLGGTMIVSLGLLRTLSGKPAAVPAFAQDTRRSDMLAMNAVMQAERRLGYVLRDVSEQNLGCDVESSIPGHGHPAVYRGQGPLGRGNPHDHQEGDPHSAEQARRVLSCHLPG